eukprot:jgi/Mesen1/8990/ME000056S08397
MCWGRNRVVLRAAWLYRLYRLLGCIGRAGWLFLIFWVRLCSLLRGRRDRGGGAAAGHGADDGAALVPGDYPLVGRQPAAHHLRRARPQQDRGQEPGAREDRVRHPEAGEGGAGAAGRGGQGQGPLPGLRDLHRGRAHRHRRPRAAAASAAQPHLQLHQVHRQVRARVCLSESVCVCVVGAGFASCPWPL